MDVSYNYSFITLSISVAILGTYVTLLILAKTEATRFFAYKGRLAVAAFVMGIAVWSMHFLGMLALNLPIPVQYAFVPTLISSLLAITLTGLAFYAATSGIFKRYGLLLGSILMGFGISSMHYVGMEALRIVCGLRYSSVMAFLAISASVIFSYVTLWLITNYRVKRGYILLAAILLGVGISSMHYIAVYGTTFEYLDGVIDSQTALSGTYMKSVLALIAFLMFNTFFLLTLPKAKTKDFKRDFRGQINLSTAANLTDLSPANKPVVNIHYEPWNSTGVVTQNENANPEATAPASDDSTPHVPTESDHEAAPTEWPHGLHHDMTLSINNRGKTQYISVGRILFISADGHYAKIGYHDEKSGEFTTHFCERTLSTVLTMLQDKGFIRVHRSHIVNLNHVEGHNKKGENGEIIFDLASAPQIPISRSQYSKFCDRLQKHHNTLQS